MDQERARELQGKLVQQAAASLVLTGSGEDVDAYEQVVSLIGKAWDLPMSGTAKQLALIEQERAADRTRDKSGTHRTDPGCPQRMVGAGKRGGDRRSLRDRNAAGRPRRPENSVQYGDDTGGKPESAGLDRENG